MQTYLSESTGLQSADTQSMLVKMMFRLHELALNAEPTPFHTFLQSLNARGQLLRVYSQNIDGMEKKSGLTSGIPKVQEVGSTEERERGGRSGLELRLDPQCEIPICIPVHGSCHDMYCPICNQHSAIVEFLPSIAQGTLPLCPRCSSRNQHRVQRGMRRRPIPLLRPNVTLYNEGGHPDAEAIGEVTLRDLNELGAARAGHAILIVAGTRMAIPGIQKIIESFAKIIKQRNPRTGYPRVILLNDQQPKASRWTETFDIWLKGNLQDFAKIAHELVASEYNII